MAIKFVSLNIWEGGMLMEALLDFLAREDAEVLLLQEVYNNPDSCVEARHRSLQTLLERLSYPHHHFVADYLERECSGKSCKRGNAILSKFPLHNTSAWFFDKPYSESYVNTRENAHDCPRNLQYALVDTPDGNIHTFNIHGVWDLDGNNFSPARQLMCNAIIDSITGKKNIVVAGDTNALPTNQAIQHVQSHLKSVFDGDLSTSFNLKRKDHPGYRTSVVDMIFTDYTTRVISKECPKTDISDHLPLIATLQF